jgi:CDP-diacylglycerol---glycerol-3-phosphate 3-phosphatidyltransferase
MANLVTLGRFPLLALILGLMYWAGPIGQLISVPLILLLMLMDCFDGMIARRYNESSLLGSALDIAADRAVELVLWVAFASLHVVSLIIPLVVIVRGTLTDSIRAVAASHGDRAFNMLHSQVGRFLVASPAMRTTYAISKGLAFCTLALTAGLAGSWGASAPGSTTHMAWSWIATASQAFSWLAFALCLLRGLPVLIEAPAYFARLSQSEG